MTKALTAIDPDHPELAAAREAGDPGRAVAAGRRRRRGRADARRRRRDARQEHDRGLAGPRPRRRRAPTRRRSSARCCRRRSPAARRPRPAGASGDAFVVEADEYAGNFDAYRPDVAVLTSAEWDHPDVFADQAAVVDTFEAWLRRAPTWRARSSPTSATPGVEAILDRLADWPVRSSPTRWSTRRPQRLGGYARAIAERFATAAGPATALLGRRDRARPERHDASSSTGSTRWPGRHRPDSRPPAATTPPTRWPSPGPRLGPGHRAGRRSRTASPTFDGRRAAPGAQGRGRRRRRLRRLRPPPDGDPRDARAPSASASPAAASGPSTSR